MTPTERKGYLYHGTWEPLPGFGPMPFDSGTDATTTTYQWRDVSNDYTYLDGMTDL